jgi:hypothetical protein
LLSRIEGEAAQPEAGLFDCHHAEHNALLGAAPVANPKLIQNEHRLIILGESNLHENINNVKVLIHELKFANYEPNLINRSNQK